ncbi:hypothetical protein FHETE_2236 [Fusarium heterosporum]|uniref:Uncharacterized protein n=1 Tax=Fusarium heterosporum TaxID=42747 RepID=A0A8H5TVU6_FUSHE|nr:hypothetical protein FHETE_2236 [Fusarium heterosporum]
MKHLLTLALATGLLTRASANDHIPRQTQAPAINPRAEEYFYFLNPPRRDQIVLNPPAPSKVKGSIGVWTEYLTEAGGTTSWIGPDPSYISVETTTSKNAEGAAVTGTVNKAIDVVKHANGGLDMILSPAFREKVEAILKEVPPCTKRKLRRRQGPSCGIEAAARRVLEDEGVADMFSDQVHNEISANAGLDSDADSGYGTDEDGFVEGAEGPAGSEAGETVEAVVLGSEADAAAIAAAAGEVEGAVVVSGITLTAVTFLGILMKAMDTTGKIEPVYHIPPEDIQTVSKTKSETTQRPTSTTSASSCPTGLPDCEDDCKATKIKDAKPTEIPWACSEGDIKGCRCNPKSQEITHFFDDSFENMIQKALKNLNGPDEPEEPEITCPNDFSSVPSEFFGDIADGFCDYIKDDLDIERKDVLFGIDGGKIPILSRRSTRLVRRAPPEDRKYYKDFKFAISWTPAEGECLIAENMCTEAFKKLVLAQPCGQNHGSANNRMTVDAKIDVGCGEFKWNVIPPKEQEPELPGLGAQGCYKRHKQDDVPGGGQDTMASKGCRDHADNKKIKAGDKPVSWSYADDPRISHLRYRISWKEGCKGPEEYSLQNPVDDASCYDLMRANYKSCNNGGAGGFRDAGCLRYEFFVE